MPRTLACSNCVVMTAFTSRCGLAVIDGLQRGHPHIGGVATITQITGQRVSAGFKGRTADSIVAAGLGTRLARNQSMVKRRSGPSIGSVT